MNIEILQADYHDPRQGDDLIFLLNAYAEDPMGGGKGLSPEVCDQLLPALAALPHAVSLIAYVDAKPAGLANCFESFSTFACRKLLNIHDLAVLREYRGQGISQALLAALEALATDRACAKLTLEVQEENHVAKRAYQRFGFAPSTVSPTSGAAQFWEKSLGRG
ncbi:MAG: GNAT family N-acetyltransferase [Pseudomonadota bacterium]